MIFYVSLQDQHSHAALTILCEYLTDTSVSPLQREFIEVADPFCSDVRRAHLQNPASISEARKNNLPASLQISYSIAENSEGYVLFKFKNVPYRKLDEIELR